MTAQQFPTKPVRLIVSFPPGGATDIIGRLLAAKMQEVWGQPVVVENRPGAGTVVGTDVAAKAAPDGHTLATVITAHVINPSLRPSMPYDTLKDLAHVTLVSTQHLVMSVHPSVEANNVVELVALARKNPGKLSYATPGSGTAMHLSMELLKIAAGVDIVHVPYKGGAPAQQDVMAGRVPILLDVHYAAVPLIKAGRIRVIGLLSPRRVAAMPEIPVIAESFPGVSALSMLGIVTAAGVPKDVVGKISSDISRAVKFSDLNAKMVELGMEPVGSTPAEFEAYVRTEIDKWAQAVKVSGARID